MLGAWTSKQQQTKHTGPRGVKAGKRGVVAGRCGVAACRQASVVWWRKARTSTTMTLFSFLALFWSLVHGMSHLQSHLCAVWSASKCQLGQSSASECVTRIDRVRGGVSFGLILVTHSLALD